MGVPAITTRGLKENHMDQVVDLIDRVLMSPDDTATIEGVREEVKRMMQAFPLYPEL